MSTSFFKLVLSRRVKHIDIFFNGRKIAQAGRSLVAVPFPPLKEAEKRMSRSDRLRPKRRADTSPVGTAMDRTTQKVTTQWKASAKSIGR